LVYKNIRKNSDLFLENKNPEKNLKSATKIILSSYWHGFRVKLRIGGVPLLGPGWCCGDPLSGLVVRRSCLRFGGVPLLCPGCGG